MKLLNHKDFNNKIGVYSIKCLKNNKIYIGSTCDSLYKRINNHYNSLIKNSHSNNHLQRAWNKYKEDNFEISVIEILDNSVENTEVLQREEFYINFFKSADKNKGFNIFKYPHTSKGNKWSDEAKIKRKDFGKGRIVSIETRKKLSESLKNRTLKESTKEKLRNLPKNNRGIVMLSLIGEFVKEFRNIKEASIYLNTITTPICKVLAGKQKTCKNHYFLYKENYNPKTLEKVARYNTKKIIQCDLQGNFIQEFISLTEAENALKLTKGANVNISKCCTNKRKSAYGFKWAYKNEM